MSIRIKCGGCSKRLSAPSKKAGCTVKCPACGASIFVPTVEAAAAAAKITDLLDQELAGGPVANAAKAVNLEEIQIPTDFNLAPALGLPPSSDAGITLRSAGPVSQPAIARRARGSGGGVGLSPVVLWRRKQPLLVLAGGILAFMLFADLGRPVSGMVFGAIGIVLGLGAWHSQGLAERRSPALASWRSLENGIGTILLMLLAVVFTLAVILDAIKGQDEAAARLGTGGVATHYFSHFVGWAFWIAIGAAIHHRAEKVGFSRPAGWAVLPIAALFWASARYGPDREAQPTGPDATAQSAGQVPTDGSQANSLPLVSRIQRSPLRDISPGVVGYDVQLGIPPESPGHADQLYIYLPQGEHAKRSLGCVLIAAAGGNLLRGAALGDSDRKEHFPYAKAGFAVVAYETDGDLSSEETRNPKAGARAYHEFAATEGGLVNARNAIRYISENIPEVDPARIYAVGHSSAGTLALLVAENEPAIEGCVAFAAVTDTVQDSAEIMRMTGPGADEMHSFIRRTSPRTNEANLNCPVFLFHAMDDNRVPPSHSKEFAKRLKQLGKQVTVETVPTGGHFNAMIQVGVPRAVQWLCALEGRTLPGQNRPQAASPTANLSGAGDQSTGPDGGNASPGHATTSDMLLKPGDRVEIQLGGRWEQAEFVERVSDRIIRVRRDNNPTPIPVTVDRVRIGGKKSE
jgi:dienelactone hydrolase/ribosomal protein S27E